jgi:hypothetical protein
VRINSPENRTLSFGIYSLIASMKYSRGNWPCLFARVAIVVVQTVLAAYPFGMHDQRHHHGGVE